MHTLPISHHLRARTVHVVAEQLDDELQDALQSGCGVWDNRPFAPRDLHDVVLVLAATGSAERDGEVARAARVPVAIAGRPEISDFELPVTPLAHRLGTMGRLGTDPPPRHNQPL